LEKEDLIIDEMKMKVSISVSELIDILDVVNFYANGANDGGKVAADLMDKGASADVTAQVAKIMNSYLENSQNN